MKIDDVRRTAYSMPLTNPSFPRGPYRFFNREFFVITYRTDPEALAAVVPEPLEVVDGVVKYEFIRMPDSTGFGDYTETGQVIPVRFKGQETSPGLKRGAHARGVCADRGAVRRHGSYVRRSLRAQQPHHGDDDHGRRSGGLGRRRRLPHARSPEPFPCDERRDAERRIGQLHADDCCVGATPCGQAQA